MRTVGRSSLSVPVGDGMSPEKRELLNLSDAYCRSITITITICTANFAYTHWVLNTVYYTVPIGWPISDSI